MKLKKNIATSDNGFIFNPATGDSYSSNEVGAEIIKMMKENLTVEEIKDRMQQRYDVEPSQLDRDWDDWILQLKDANLIEAGN